MANGDPLSVLDRKAAALDRIFELLDRPGDWSSAADFLDWIAELAEHGTGRKIRTPDDHHPQCIERHEYAGEEECTCDSILICQGCGADDTTVVDHGPPGGVKVLCDECFEKECDEE